MAADLPERRVIIIDAYNCLHAASAMSGPLSGISLRQLGKLVSSSGQKVILVMDGLPKPSEPKADEFINVELLYSGKSAKADDLIARILQKSTGRREITVVSNDRQVAAQARRSGAKSISCERFLALQAKENRRSAGMRQKIRGNKNDTDFWLKEFGISNPPVEKAADKKMDQINPEDINMEDYL